MSKQKYTVEINSEEDIYNALSYYIQKTVAHKNSQLIWHRHPEYILKDDIKLSTIFKYKGNDVKINIYTYKDPKLTTTQNTRAYLRFIKLESSSLDVINKYVEHAYDVYTKDHFYKNNTITIWTPNKMGSWNFYSTLRKRNVESVILDKGIKENIISDINTFHNAENIYDKYGIPYKRVYCLYGPPGTGKTSIIFSIASNFNKNIAMMNFGKDITDSVFTSLISRLPENTILVLEDIDSLSAKRNTSSSASGHVSFSTLLNVLDGNLLKNGIMVFMTTNYIDKLDDALLRKGRTDLMINITYISKYQMEEFAKLYYPKITKAQIAEYVKLISRYKNLVTSKVSSFMFLNRDLSITDLLKLLKSKKDLN